MIGALEGLTGAQGRLQRISAETGRGEVYVDYAHTPDGLETVLTALRPHSTGRLTVVFGAGGDRDRRHPPPIGGLAGRLPVLPILPDDQSPHADHAPNHPHGPHSPSTGPGHGPGAAAIDA